MERAFSLCAGFLNSDTILMPSPANLAPQVTTEFGQCAVVPTFDGADADGIVTVGGASGGEIDVLFAGVFYLQARGRARGNFGSSLNWV